MVGVVTVPGQLKAGMLSGSLGWLSPPLCSSSICTSAPHQLESVVVDEMPLTSSGILPGCGNHVSWQPGLDLILKKESSLFLYAWEKGQGTEPTL